MGVACSLESASEAVAIAAAVARAFPTYSAKSTSESRHTETGRAPAARQGSGPRRAFAIAGAGDASAPSSPATRSRRRRRWPAACASPRASWTHPALMDPDALVREALGACAELNASVVSKAPAIRWRRRRLREAELIAGGFGGIVGVGAAACATAASPPWCTSCRGAGGANARSTALVGKGITFDTGGLQIKGKSGMPGMKTDLGGAAAALGAFRAAVALDPDGARRGGGTCTACCASLRTPWAPRVPARTMCCCARAPAAEINNTARRGSVGSADGARDGLGGVVDADDVVDVATLTGAQMVATGRRFAGIVRIPRRWRRRASTRDANPGSRTRCRTARGVFLARVWKRCRGHAQLGEGPSQRAGFVRGAVHRRPPRAGLRRAERRRGRAAKTVAARGHRGAGHGEGHRPGRCGVALLVELLHATRRAERCTFVRKR